MRRFALGLVLGIVIAWAALSGTTSLPFASVASASPTPTVPAAIVPQLNTLQQALDQAKTDRRPVPLTLVFNEAQLTAAATAYFPISYAGARISDPIVHLRAGRLTLDTRATLAIVQTTATVVTTPIVVSGRPSVRVDSATLGGQSLPDAVKQALAADIAGAISAGVPANLVVSSITVGEGTLTVVGVANP